jgi:hypothetical protein
MMTSAVAPGVASSDALIWGIAVTTIVPSRFSMKKHAATRSATLRKPPIDHRGRSKAQLSARGRCGWCREAQHAGAQGTATTATAIRRGVAVRLGDVANEHELGCGRGLVEMTHGVSWLGSLTATSVGRGDRSD